MTLLTVAQQILKETKNAVIPSTIMGNNEDSAKQVLEALTVSITSLARICNWQELQREHTFISSGVEGYDLPADFDRFVNETFWNATRMCQVEGPMTPIEWRTLKNSTIGGGASFDFCRIRAGQVLIFPTPATGVNYIYEYISNLIVLSSADVGQTTWLADTDVAAIDEYILRLDATWRLLKMQGRAFATDELLANNAIAERVRVTGGRKPIRHTSKRMYRRVGYPSIIVAP